MGPDTAPIVGVVLGVVLAALVIGGLAFAGVL